MQLHHWQLREMRTTIAALLESLEHDHSGRHHLASRRQKKVPLISRRMGCATCHHRYSRKRLNPSSGFHPAMADPAAHQ